MTFLPGFAVSIRSYLAYDIQLTPSIRILYPAGRSLTVSLCTGDLRRMSDSASLRYHLAQLAELCRSRPLAPKIGFVPTVQIGHNLGTALSRAGVSWINLHLTTTSAWAERLAGPMLRESGRRPLVQDADHFFMLRSVKQAAWPADHPFARGNSAGGLAQTFLRTIRGLRLAGVGPDELSNAEISLDGRRVFMDLYRAYTDWLYTERLYDRADLYREATRTEPDDDLLVAVFDETPLPETAYRFVRSLSSQIVRIGRSSYGMPAPQHSGRERFDEAPIAAGAIGSVGPASTVMSGGVDPVACAGIDVRESVGVENEVRGVLRELLGRGVTLDQIELVYTTEDPYLPLLVDAMERLRLPASYASGVPVTLTRPGQALIGFYQWIASGFDVALMVRLLRSRLLFLLQQTGAPELESPEVAETLLEARVGRGRSAWKPALDRYLERLAGRAEGASDRQTAYLQRRSAGVRRIIEWMGTLQALVPPGETASLAEMANAGAAFIDRFAQKTGTDRDIRAAESLADRLGELADGASVEGSLSDLALSLADLMAEHKVEAAVARPGHLYVVPLERAGYTGRKQTVVLGLSEATFPGAATEDPILLDAERERIPGAKLVLQRARVSEPIWHLERVLGAANSDVLLTANRRDLSDGRETYPAAIFEQLKEQLAIEPPCVYRGVPNPDEVLTADEAAMVLRDQPSAVDDVVRGRPWLEAGMEAVRARAHPSLGRFDGWLGRSAPELRPGPGAAVSASRLENLASCPYRYFLRNVLKVRPPDVPEDLPGRWLTPLEFGSLLHDVLRAFMEEVTARGERVDVEQHEGLMTDILHQTVDRHSDRIPMRNEAGYRADMRRLQRAVRIFLTEESRRDVRPVGFEVSFGRGHDEGLSAKEPVSVSLSDDVQIVLTGSIDRVDEVDGGYEVWDYKSGSGRDYDESDMLSGGRRLQWALYAYALEELLRRSGMKGRTTRSGYFFTNEREHGLRLGDEPPPRERVGRALSPLLDLVEQGAFLHVQKHKACTFCDYRTICASERKDSKDLADVQETSADAPFLSALKRWMEV